MESDSRRTILACVLHVVKGMKKKAVFVSTVEVLFPKGKKSHVQKSIHSLWVQSGLILAGAIGYFLTGGLESKLVGKVNGEGITRKEFSKRLERAKKFYELRYGQNLFKGEKGKENLNRLKTDILDEMTTEKILLQEAKSAGYNFCTRRRDCEAGEGC